MGESQHEMPRHAEVLLRWFFTVGQTVFLRSSQGGLESRLRSSAVPRTPSDYVSTVDDRSPVTSQSAEDWRAYLQEQMDAGAGRASLPFAPLITARPTAEIQPSPDPDIDDRDWARIAEASGMVARLKRLEPRAEAVLDAMYGDHGLEWPAGGFRHGALYRFDEHAIALLGTLRKHEAARVAKAKMGMASRTDLQLMAAEAERAAQFSDADAARDLAAIEARARGLLAHVGRLWVALESSEDASRGDVRAAVAAALADTPAGAEGGV